MEGYYRVLLITYTFLGFLIIVIVSWAPNPILIIKALILRA